MARSYVKLLNWLAMGTAQVLPRHIPLLARALGDADPKVRRRALRLIEKAGPIALRALPYVIKMLGDRDKAVRAAAAWCLAGLGQGAHKAVPDLMRLLRDDETEVRRAAIQSIESIGLQPTDKAADLLPAVEDKDTIVQRVAVRVLKQIAPWAPEAASYLHVAILDDDWEIFEEAARALGKMGQSATPAVSTLLTIYADGMHSREAVRVVLTDVFLDLADVAVKGLEGTLEETDPALRSTALEFLEQMGPDARMAFPTLVKALDDPDPEVRINAVRAMVAIGAEPERAVPLFIPLLKDKLADVRDAAAEALGRLGPAAQEAVPHLVDNLDSKFAEGTFSSAFALGAIGSAAGVAVPKLLRIIKSGPREKRQAAIYALGKIAAHPEKVVPALTQFIKSDDEWMRDYAAEALINFGADAAPFLQLALRSEGAKERRTILEALRKASPELSDKAAELFDAMRNVDWDQVRDAASDALREAGLGDITHLIDDLDDPDKKVRIAAIRALGEMGPEAREAGPLLFEVLLKSLADDRFGVRMAAQDTLNDIRGWNVAEVSAALHHPSKYVRRWAADELKHLDPRARQSANFLLSALDDEDWQVRSAARSILEHAGSHVAPKLMPLLESSNKSLRRWAKRHLESLDHAVEVAVAGATASPTPEIDMLQGAGVGSVSVGEMAATSAALSAAGAGSTDATSVEMRREVARGHGDESLGIDGDLFSHRAKVKSEEAAVKNLVNDLRSYNDQLARASSRALVKIGRAAVPALTEILKTGNYEERRRAAKVLGKIGPAASAGIPQLRELTSDNNPSAVRLAARAALRRLRAS